jgi:zinc protease
VAFRGMRQALFGPHPLALDRDGTPESLAGLTAQQCREWHQKLTVGGNVVLAVFGDIDPQQCVDRLESKLSAGPQGERLITPEGVGHASGFATSQQDIIRDKKQAVLAVGFPTVPLHHPDRPALDLLDEACSDMASRLFLRIREQHGLAYYTGSFQILAMAPGAFAFYLGTSPDQLDKAQSELLDEIQLLGRHGLEDEEFTRVKAAWLGKHLMQRQSAGPQARGIALDVLYGLEVDHAATYAQRVREVSLEEVRRVAATYFLDQPHAIVRVRPE